MDSGQDVTAMLNRLATGGSDVQGALLAAVHAELRAIAQAHLRGERRDHTLQATDLVHEAYLRLVRGSSLPWDSRRHFFHAAATAMRRILVEHARRRGRLKHGGGASRLPNDVLDLAEEHDPEKIVALDEALRRLEERDPSMASVVQFRFFAGLSVEETAGVMGISPRTVKREWACARAWLYRALEGEPNDGGGAPAAG